MNGGTVTFHFEGDDKKLNSSVGSVSKNLSGIAGKIGSAFAKGTAVAAAGISALVGASVKAYGEFEQLSGGIEALFGKGSQEMQKVMQTSENAYKNLTMSQNDYLNAFNNTYSIMKNGIGKNADAIEYTNKMIQISSDLYNTYGGSIEQYSGAINWALKGTYSYLDNLNIGIKGTKEGFIEAANQSGVLNKKIKDTSELTNDEIVKVIEYYAKNAGALGRTAKEAETTIQGSFNMMKASWSDLLVAFTKGGDLSKPIDNLISSAGKFGAQIIPAIQTALGSIANALPSIINKIVSVLPGLLQSILPGLIKSVVNLIQSLVTYLPQLIPILIQGISSLIQGIVTYLPTIVTSLIQAVVLLLNSLADQLPTLLPILVNAIIDGIITLLDNIDDILLAGVQILMALIQGIITAIPILVAKLPLIIQSIINTLIGELPLLIGMAPEIIIAIITGLLNAIPMLIQMTPQIIMALINGLFKGLEKFVQIGGSMIKSMYNGIKNSFMNILGKIPGIPRDIVNKIKAGFSGIENVGRNIMQGLWNGIQGLKNWVIDKVKGIGKSILNGLKGVLGIHSPSTEFAMVGKFSMLGYEEGLEKMQPEIQKSIDSMFNLSPQMTGSMNNSLSPSINVQNNVSVETDPLGQVVNKIKTFSGGSRNDYNYGVGV